MANQSEPQSSDPHDAWVASLHRDPQPPEETGDRLVYENLACAVYHSPEGTHTIV